MEEAGLCTVRLVEPSYQQPLTSPLVDLFLELCAIPSPSGRERAVADRVGAFLTGLGLEWDEDDAATRLEGDTGNIYCRIPPTNGGGTPIFLCAHTDTVPPERAIEPVVGEDGIVRNAAGTILGADNKAAVVVLLESTKRILDERRPHAGIELLFTAQEEVSLRGADAFDHTRLVADTGFVYDQGAPDRRDRARLTACARSRVPVPRSLRARGNVPRGRPLRRRRGIARDRRLPARADRRGDERERRRDHGGTARNVVPEWCSFSAEVRSHDERKAVDLVREMLETAAFAASLGECEVESEVRPSFPGYRFRESDSPVALAATALRAAGFEPSYALSGGGADANVFNARGLSCVNLANGMMEIHTPDEHIAVGDLDAMVEVTLALVDARARELGKSDRAVVGERPAGVVRDLPRMPVRVDEDPGIAAPEGLRAAAPDRRPCRLGFGQNGIYFGRRANVVRERDTTPAASIGHGGVLGELLPAPERDDHAPGLEEDDVVLRLRSGRPAERLVERARPREIGDAERDEADALLHQLISTARSSVEMSPDSSRRQIDAIAS